MNQDQLMSFGASEEGWKYREVYFLLTPYIRLSTNNPRLRRHEWRPWKKLGYRVLAEDGVTVYHEREAIKLTVLDAFNNVDADIFLFGSQATGRAHEKSDYDIGYYTDEKISANIIIELKEKLEEMPIPAQVDLVDFTRLSAEFVQIALKGGVEIWKQKRKNSLFLSVD